MDDDDFGSHRGPSPFFLMQMMGSFIPIMAVAILMPPMLLYIVARWRDHREPTPDPHLGVKFALGLFKWQGYQLAIAGAGMLLYSITTKMPGEMREMLYRPAFGLLLPGLLVFGVAAWALTRTNNMERPIVSRVLGGYNLLLTGIIAFALLVFAFQTLFAKGESGDAGRAIWSFTFVYVTAWIAQTAMFLQSVGASAPVIPPPAS